MSQSNLTSFTASTNLGFGGQPQQSSLFPAANTSGSLFGGVNATSATQTTTGFSMGQPATSAFGGQTGSLFGAAQPAQPSAFGGATTSLFGQSPAQPANNGLAVGAAPTGSLFGTQPAAFPQAQPQTSSLFGAQPASGSLFGAQPAAGSLFGAQPATGSLFGTQPVAGMLGAATQPAQTGWNANPGQPQQPSLFGQTTPQPAFGQPQQALGQALATSFFGQTPSVGAAPLTPAPGSMFSQLAAPLLSQSTTQGLQDQGALAQMLLAFALSQNQQAQSGAGATPNPALNNGLQLLSQMLTTFSQNSNNSVDPNKKLLPDTPFD